VPIHRQLGHLGQFLLVSTNFHQFPPVSINPMTITKKIQQDSFTIKFEARQGNRVVGRAFLYVLKNDLHKEPFGFMEDVFVEESHRRHGLGTKLVEAVIREAKEKGCYKLVGNSRSANSNVHEFYKKFGFVEWGREFRMDFGSRRQ